VCKGIPAEGSCPVGFLTIEQEDSKALEQLGLSKIEVRDSVDEAKNMKTSSSKLNHKIKVFS
jgi:hypothetical protein